MEHVKKKWIAFKGRLTIFINKVKKGGYLLVEVEQHFKTHEERMHKLWEEMIIHASPDEMDSINEDYYAECDRMRITLRDLKQKEDHNEESASSYHEQPNNGGYLPELKLPTFNGQPTDAQKMQFLESALKDEACNAIKHTPVTEENKTNRYKNKRLIANTYAQRMITLPNINEGHSLRELMDCFHESSEALRTFLPEADLWEIIASSLILAHVDSETLDAWELSLQTTEVPSLERLISFLEIRARVQESMKVISTTSKHEKSKKTEPSSQCPECKGDHKLWSCSKFIQMEVGARWKMIRMLNLCRNCLSAKHYAAQCKASKCKKCQKSHHSLLHKEEELKTCTTNQVLMPTAIMDITDMKGRKHRIKVLLGTGSQVNIVTRNLVKRLQLKTKSRGKECQTASGKCQLSRKTVVTVSKGEWQRNINCYITDQLNMKLPEQAIQGTWSHLQDLELADPEFWKPQEIELILGAHITTQLWTEGLKRGQESKPIAQNSILGWVISGPTENRTQQQQLENVFNCEADNELRRFWELEEVPQQ